MTNETKKLAVVETTKANGKTPELSNLKVTEPKAEKVTFDQVLTKTDSLIKLKEKRERFIYAGEKLNRFVLNSNEEAGLSEIHVSDSKGGIFSTKNAELIFAVVEFMKKTISEKLAATEAEIMSIF